MDNEIECCGHRRKKGEPKDRIYDRDLEILRLDTLDLYCPLPGHAMLYCCVCKTEHWHKVTPVTA